MQIAQMKHHIRQEKRMAIARSFIDGAAFNMLKNLRYYTNRGKDTRQQMERIEAYISLIATATDIPMLMGIEGNIRQPIMRHLYDYRGFFHGKPDKDATFQ